MVQAVFEICSLLSPHQWTPLHWAAFYGHTDTVHYLTEKGANINIKDDDGVRNGTVMLLIEFEFPGT